MLAVVGGEWEDRGALIFRGVIVAVVVALIGLGWAGSVDRPLPPHARDPAPRHLRQHPGGHRPGRPPDRHRSRMYSAYWCPHCHDQKELFGKEATKKLKVIECAADGNNSRKDLCDTKRSRVSPPGKSRASSIPVSSRWGSSLS